MLFCARLRVAIGQSYISIRRIAYNHLAATASGFSLSVLTGASDSLINSVNSPSLRRLRGKKAPSATAAAQSEGTKAAAEADTTKPASSLQAVSLLLLL